MFQKMTAVVLAVVVVGCSTAAKDVPTSYVSPLQFQSYDCGQLTQESGRLQARVVELGGRLDQAASNDKAITGVGVVLFWPALFALGGTKQQEAEFGRLKGEYDAVQQESIRKKCTAPILASAPEAASSAAPAASTP